MAADRLSEAGHRVVIFEKRRTVGRKLLVAGASGLNVTNTLPLPQFVAHYVSATAPAFWEGVIGEFPPEKWIAYIEALGVPTFVGSTGRAFVEDMKAAGLVRAWKDRLIARGVEFQFGAECVGFAQADGGVELAFAQGQPTRRGAAACLALGGASWEPLEVPLRWPEMFRARGVAMDPFAPSNVGFEVRWPAAFLREAEGKPLKRVVMKSPRGTRAGEVMITAYGVEGTPVYFVGQAGEVIIDLVPDLSREQIVAKLRAVKENLSAPRRIAKALKLGEVASALAYHCSPKTWLESRDLRAIADRLKAFPLRLEGPRPLAEAISSSGGVAFSEVGDDLMLRKVPGVFVAGEMLSWNVPTGGFLIQGCVALGHRAAGGIARYLRASGAGKS